MFVNVPQEGKGNGVPVKKRVIAMAYGKQPLDRLVVQESEALVHVVNPDRDLYAVERERLGVGFPREFVFEEDAQLLAQLAEAYESGDSSRLDSLWETAAPFPLHLHETEERR